MNWKILTCITLNAWLKLNLKLKAAFVVITYTRSIGIGERLNCIREERNAQDRYAVAIKIGWETVGYIPRYISTLCSLFIRRGETIFCVVTGRRRYSRDLPQGGMEIPCKYRFVGSGKEIRKVRSYTTKPVNHLSSSRNEDRIQQSSSIAKHSSSQPSLPERTDDSSDLPPKADNIESSKITTKVSSKQTARRYQAAM